MNNLFSGMDAKATLKYLNGVQSKLMKGAELLTDIEEIDVGTAEKELIYAEYAPILHQLQPSDHL